MRSSCSRSEISTKAVSNTDTPEYNFVETLDARYTCSICTGLLKEPHLTECCGHHFCEECLKKWGESDKKALRSSCPHCREKPFAHIHDKPLQREINDLSVYCSNKKLGCGWEGKVVQFEQHLETCEFVQIKCEKCDKSILKKGEAVHLEKVCKWREASCLHCHKKGPDCEINSLEHMSSCVGFSVLCPNKCSTELFLRSQLKQHLQDVCPTAPVECPFREAGCVMNVQRKDLQSHMSTAQPLHLLMMLDTVKKQSSEIKMLTRFKQRMEASIMEVTSEIDKILQQPTSPFAVRSGHNSQLTSIRDSLSVYPLLWLSPENPRICLSLIEQSRPFYVNDGYKFRIEITNKTDCQVVSLCILPGEYDDKIKWPPAVDFNSIVLSNKDFSFNLGKGCEQCESLPARKLSYGQSHEVCRYKHLDSPRSRLVSFPSKKTKSLSNSEITVTLQLDTLSSTATNDLVSKMTLLALQGGESGNIFQSSFSPVKDTSPSKGIKHRSPRKK